MTKQILRITCDETQIVKRARRAVETIVASGTDHQEIARLTDTTVLSLLDGATPILRRPQFNALARHFNVSRMWLWTGHGDMFLNESTIKAIIS